MPLTVEDRVMLNDLLGRYCQMVDAGDPQWAELFTEDGVLAGIFPEPIAGRAALRGVPDGARANSGGFWRHHVNSVMMDESEAGARIRAYNLVTDWSAGGKFVMNARYDMQAVQTADGWRLKHVDVVVDQ